jgi:chromosome condensin MukBEF complex kleisin-like MukF subunit
MGDRHEAIKDRTGWNRESGFVIGLSRKRLAFLVVVSALVAVTVLIPANAEASSNCGTSGGS